MKTLKLSLLIMIIITGCSKQEDIRPLKQEKFDAYLDMMLLKLLTKNSDGIGRSFYILPDSDDLDNIPQDPNNPLTHEKIVLGKLLFHDAALAVDSKFENFRETYSCATCHHHQAGFQAGVPQGISEGGIGFGVIGESRTKDDFCPEDSLDIQPIRTPTILNSAYQQVMLWNGQFGATGPNTGTEALWTPGTPLENNFLGFEGVETQAIAGLSVHRLNIPEDLLFSTEYKDMFDAAFPDLPESERYTLISAGLAIAAYERIVLSNQSPFQKYLRGNKFALTDQQKEGAILFFGKANCASCHNGPALNSMEFYALGMNDLEGHGVFGAGPDLKTKLGRGGFTGKEKDQCKFKVPQLYSLRQARIFGHGSSFISIEDVVRYKNKAIKENDFVPDTHLAKSFVPLGLNNNEIKQLTAFLEFGLYDAELDRYTPTSVPSGLCIPNNDELSRIDLGCLLP